MSAMTTVTALLLEIGTLIRVTQIILPLMLITRQSSWTILEITKFTLDMTRVWTFSILVLIFSISIWFQISFLKHLLRVHSVTKNLLSVSQFAADNKMFFKFLPNHCYVKDQVSNSIVITRKLKDGLYVFGPPHFLSNSSSKIHTNSRSMSLTTTPTTKSYCHAHKPTVPSVVSA